MHVTYSVYGARNCSDRQGGVFSWYRIGPWDLMEEGYGRMGDLDAHVATMGMVADMSQDKDNMMEGYGNRMAGLG
jgi:hypothetical protein